MDPAIVYATDHDSHAELCGCASADHERGWPRHRCCGCLIVPTCVHDAAPDLRAALERFVRGAEEDQSHTVPFAVVYEARAALRKAQGPIVTDGTDVDLANHPAPRVRKGKGETHARD